MKFHPTSNIIKNRYENEADYFSTELYLDGTDLYCFKNKTMEEMATELTIPIQLLKLKLK